MATITRIKTCKNCQVAFGAQRSTATFCSKACQAAFTRAATEKKKQRKTRDEAFTSDAFFDFLKVNIKRAGTIEILGPRDQVDLAALESIHTYIGSVDGVAGESRKGRYHICHMKPAKGIGELGLLTVNNLYVGTSSFNQSIGNRPSPVGRAIEINQLDDEWRYHATTSDAQLKAKIRKYVGPAKFDAFLASRKTRVSGLAKQRRELAKWQTYLFAGDIPENAPEAIHTLLEIDPEVAPGHEVKDLHKAIKALMADGMQFARIAQDFHLVARHEIERLLPYATGERADALRSVQSFLPMVASRASPFPDTRIASFGMRARDLMVEEFEVAVQECLHGDAGAWSNWLEDALEDITLHLPEDGNAIHAQLIAAGKVAPFTPSFVPPRPTAKPDVEVEVVADKPKAKTSRPADYVPKWERQLSTIAFPAAPVVTMAVPEDYYSRLDTCPF